MTIETATPFAAPDTLTSTRLDVFVDELLSMFTTADATYKASQRDVVFDVLDEFAAVADFLSAGSHSASFRERIAPVVARLPRLEAIAVDVGSSLAARWSDVHHKPSQGAFYDAVDSWFAAGLSDARELDSLVVDCIRNHWPRGPLSQMRILAHEPLSRPIYQRLKTRIDDLRAVDLVLFGDNKKLLKSSRRSALAELMRLNGGAIDFIDARPFQLQQLDVVFDAVLMSSPFAELRTDAELAGDLALLWDRVDVGGVLSFQQQGPSSWFALAALLTGRTLHGRTSDDICFLLDGLVPAARIDVVTEQTSHGTTSIFTLTKEAS